jgi:exodeoxyribonuclease-3
MRVATWNVNSIKQRSENLVAWLAERQPDVVCLQETKCVDEAFPREPLEQLGYNVAVHGQKTFNGVAILSKFPFDEVTPRLPGDEGDDHARFMEAVISTTTGALRIASIYLPNGNPPATEKYTYKIKWMDRLAAYARKRLALEEPLVMAGDFNVIPTAADVYDPLAWMGDALFLPRTRQKFRALIHLGLTDAVRATTDRSGLYTFWDYQAGAWQKNNGIRIDHILLSPQAADRLSGVAIDRHVRGLGEAIRSRSSDRGARFRAEPSQARLTRRSGRIHQPLVEIFVPAHNRAVALDRAVSTSDLEVAQRVPGGP